MQEILGLENLFDSFMKAIEKGLVVLKLVPTLCCMMS